MKEILILSTVVAVLTFTDFFDAEEQKGREDTANTAYQDRAVKGLEVTPVPISLSQEEELLGDNNGERVHDEQAFKKTQQEEAVTPSYQDGPRRQPLVYSTSREWEDALWKKSYQEVKSLLGKPDYVYGEGGRELWKYYRLCVSRNSGTIQTLQIQFRWGEAILFKQY